jgi:hypothetical protein
VQLIRHLFELVDWESPSRLRKRESFP